jgi:RNA polymerase sigma factor (sigma-70 family)
LSDSYGHSRFARGEEQDLVVAAEAGDEAACRRLIEAFLPAIGTMARAYRGGTIDRQELVQEGVAGLLFATRRYDASLNTPFWAYASFWVRKAMQDLVAELTRPVVLSDRAARGLAQIRRAQAEHLRAQGSEPTYDDLSIATGFTPEQLESLLATQRTPLGLEEPLGDEGGTSATVGETIVDQVAEQEYERVLDRIEVREVQDLAEQLDERERLVLRAHYGLDEPARTLSQIGATLGVTAERVRQIEAAALESLRAALSVPALPRIGEST